MKISVIIPMYNEASIIKDTAKTLYEYMSGRFEDWELLFSDVRLVYSDGTPYVVNEMNQVGKTTITLKIHCKE